MSKPANPPAFPNDPRTQLGDDFQGMTLRDWFAGQATDQDVIDYIFVDSGDWASPSRSRAAARYAFADAMLAERERGQ